MGFQCSQKIENIPFFLDRQQTQVIDIKQQDFTILLRKILTLWVDRKPKNRGKDIENKLFFIRFVLNFVDNRHKRRKTQKQIAKEVYFETSFNDSMAQMEIENEF